MGIQAIVKKLKQFDPDKIIIFGSHAYGKPTKDSDIDIAIIKNTKLPYHDRLIKARSLLRTTTPLDLFVFTKRELASKKENPFIEEIVTKGKTVYEKKNS